MKIFIFIYLLAGFVYAVYVHSIKSETRWWMFPVNVIGGPIMVVYLTIISFKRERPPLEW